MKLKIRDMTIDRCGEEKNQMDFTDIFESPVETSIGIENPIFPWVTSAHLDDNEGNPDPRVASFAREYGIDVERVLEEEVGISSSFDDHENSSSSGGDGSGGDGGGNAGGDYEEEAYSPYLNPPLYPFTTTGQHFYPSEDRNRGHENFRQESHDMQQLDDESLAMTFSSMSMGTQHNSSSDLQSQTEMRSGSSSNTQPWFGSELNSNVPSYGNYGGYSIFDYPSSQMTNEVSMNTEQQDQPTWVNPRYPIYGSVGIDEATYTWHVNNYL